LPACLGRSFPATGEQFRVMHGGFFGHCGRDAFRSGRAWLGACLHVGAVVGVIRCAWHGFMHGRPGTARVAGARARGQAGLQKPGCQAPVIFSRPPPRGDISTHSADVARRASLPSAPSLRLGPRLRLALQLSSQVCPAFPGLAGVRFTSALRAQFPRGPASTSVLTGCACSAVPGGAVAAVWGMLAAAVAGGVAGSVIRSVAWHGYLHGRRWHGPCCIHSKASCQAGLCKSHGAKLPRRFSSGPPLAVPSLCSGAG
jgi:hypothetical protein